MLINYLRNDKCFKFCGYFQLDSSLLANIVNNLALKEQFDLDVAEWNWKKNLKEGD